MSRKHPVIALTGSSGAGTSSFRSAFEAIFAEKEIKAAFIEGDGFHRYARNEMDTLAQVAAEQGKTLTHFGASANLFTQLAELFKQYSTDATGQHRYYIHNQTESELHNTEVGNLTEWQDIEPNTDLLFYEGLHGGVVTEEVNVAEHTDLLIGVVPIINLEWIQKIHRDRAYRGYTSEDATGMILRRMNDYVHYIVPQFSLTDINFQRVPIVDTSNPFAAESIPNNAESFTVIHIRNKDKIRREPAELADELEEAVLSNESTIVLPAEKTKHAIRVILQPVIEEMMANR